MYIFEIAKVKQTYVQTNEARQVKKTSLLPKSFVNV